MLVNDPKELEKIRERESDITRERIQKILAAGANVVLTTKGIDDMSLKYFVEAGAIAARRVPKDDLRYISLTPCEHPAVPGADSAEFLLLRRRIAKATGATMVLTLADMDGNESFDPSLLGAAEEVSAVSSQPVALNSHPVSYLEL